jgi:hypothetical protein
MLRAGPNYANSNRPQYTTAVHATLLIDLVLQLNEILLKANF